MPTYAGMRAACLLMLALAAAGSPTLTANAQQASLEGLDFQDVSFNAGWLSYDFRLSRVLEMTDGADLTFKPSTPGERPLRIRARMITWDWPESAEAAEPNAIDFEGNVIINHPQADIRANRGRWNVAGDAMVLSGNLTIELENNAEITGDQATLNLRTGVLDIGSPRGSGLLMRQQREGGSARLTLQDVSDWEGWLDQVNAERQADAASPGKHLWSRLDGAERSGFSTLSEAETLVDDQKRLALNALNGLLADPALYDADAWAGMSLPAEAQDLAAADAAALAEQDMIRRNRWLLHTAYPDHFAPPPGAAEE